VKEMFGFFVPFRGKFDRGGRSPKKYAYPLISGLKKNERISRMYMVSGFAYAEVQELTNTKPLN
jgi:hypothetical protein